MLRELPHPLPGVCPSVIERDDGVHELSTVETDTIVLAVIHHGNSVRRRKKGAVWASWVKRKNGLTYGSCESPSEVNPSFN